MAKISDYKNRMTSPLGVKVTTKGKKTAQANKTKKRGK